MDLELTGKRAIVTGGSVGIGKATARELAREGVDVVICARRQDILEQAAAELATETGRRIIPIVADTTSTESVEALVSGAVEELGGVDILVNNAAAPGGFVQGPLDESDDSDLLFDVNTKVVGYFRCAKAVAPSYACPRLGAHHKHRRTGSQKRRHLQRPPKRRPLPPDQDTLAAARTSRDKRQPRPPRRYAHPSARLRKLPTLHSPTTSASWWTPPRSPTS